MLFVRAAFGWALRLGVVGSTGGWRRLGGQRVRFRAERLLRVAWLAGDRRSELADIVLLARALPQMAHLTTLDLSGTTSPALCALNSMNGYAEAWAWLCGVVCWVSALRVWEL